MPHPNMQKRERVADLGQGLELWKVHIDAIREQDKNARVMALDKFERLADNIAKENRLESLPLVHNTDPADVETYFELVSGHHRVRAARKAGLQEIFVLCDTRERSRSEIIAKQLAHNALAGRDDESILAELYREIVEVDAKIESGLTDQDIHIVEPGVKVDDVSFDFQYEMLNILFLERDYGKFVQLLDTLEPLARVYVADKRDFEKFKEQARTVSRRFSVINMSAIMVKMIEIVQEALAVTAPEMASDRQGGVSVSAALGTEYVTREVADRLVEFMAGGAVVPEAQRALAAAGMDSNDSSIEGL